MVVLGATALLALRFIGGGPEDIWLCENGEWVKHGNPVLTKPTEGCGELIGGQRDEHGCLGPAGYSWCGLKQKCLRVWEEPCETTPTEKIADLLSYSNPNLGFSLELPKTWEGYRATEMVKKNPDHDYVGFSFDGTNRQPFTIFQIISYTNNQWTSVKNKSAVTILSQTDDKVLVCDGCCTTTGDTAGGGQFDDFQVSRCKEVPEILKTFRLL